MKTNIKILGWLHIVLGVLGLLVGCLVVVILMSAGLFSGDDEAILVLAIVTTFIAGLMLVLSAPGIVAGIGLLNLKSWARVLALVLAVLNLPVFPQGTVFGIYTFISLLNEDAAQLFTR